MKEIAIYGKGGIGKSAVAANLSAALAASGLRVLQIGCDPKRDSTRLLTNGRTTVTVLDYIRATSPTDYQIGDVLLSGYKNIGCLEAGGPEPGVGCAGRGIITAFELLDRFRIKDRYDITIYDVLGDVVCGGFAVPIRQGYADAVFLVASGEYMALYAANNILRGVKNYDGGRGRVAGILYNRRGLADEDERMRAFAAAVRLPVAAVIPRSDLFAQAEREKRTLVESGLDAALGGVFGKLARRVAAGMPLFPARPLSDAELERAVLGTEEQAAAPAVRAEKDDRNPPAPVPEGNGPQLYFSKNLARREPLHGCAFNGAVSMAVHLRDAAIIAHAPKSCAYLSYQSMSSAGRRGLFERGALLPVSIAPNFEATDLTEADIIFGGMAALEKKLLAVKKRKPRLIVVISACPPGIIGDDIDELRTLAEPDLPVYTVKTDGNLAGDYLQGMLLCYTSLAGAIIKRGVPPVPDTVNVVFEKVVARNTNGNFALIEGFLGRLGLRVGCRFLCETTVDRLENFLAAPLNLLAYKDYTGLILEDFFRREYGCVFLDKAFPVGLAESKAWLRALAAFFDRAAPAEEIIREYEAGYRREAEALRPVLTGKRLLIITYNHELDWILQTALDVGIDVVKICILNFSQDAGFRTGLAESFPVEENYDREKRAGDIAALAPDILLTNYASSGSSGVAVEDTIPMCPDVGFFSGLAMARRWAALLRLDLEGEWKNDERLFRKHYPR
ncbi:MAG: AAA family ATPase [Gracilibacteraceae bacterium]|nr:AAA family ATPase [Gracilibacteraceae bacterium]